MAITRAKLSGIQALATWLNENATHLLQKVEKDSSEDVWYGYDLDGKKAFHLKSGEFAAYRTDGGNAITSVLSGMFTDTNDIIMCDNGIIVAAAFQNQGYGPGYFSFLISNTNNGRLACVFSVGSNATQILYTQLKHVAIGDSTTMSTTTTFTPEAGQQTCLVPFSTNTEIGDTSYTPNAFYIVMNPNYAMGMGKFIMGADIYISNGYWAIRDGGAQ